MNQSFKKIGITQRVVLDSKTGERRDILDQAWYEVARRLGVMLIPIPNALEQQELQHFLESVPMDAFIFSGGNNIDQDQQGSDPHEALIVHDYAWDRDCTEALIFEYVQHQNKPLFGVCRGLQFINHQMGGRLSPVDRTTHVAREHEIEVLDDQWQRYFGITANVNSYHDWGIRKEDLGKGLQPTCSFQDTVEAYVSTDKQIAAVMWHPERNEKVREEDLALMKDFLNLD